MNSAKVTLNLPSKVCPTDEYSDVWAPTDPEMQEAVASRLEPELLSTASPIFSLNALNGLVDPSDEEANDVVRRINARKLVDPLYRGACSLEKEPEWGYVADLRRGHLGLVYVGSES